MTVLDLVVVGGGITGLGIARLAARNGLTVAVLERHDLASGASSATSHMLHGGLRYLEHGRFRLVREALRQRAEVSRLAPDLAHPTRFLLPFYRGDLRPQWMVRAGLALYDTLAGRANLAPHATVRPREAPPGPNGSPNVGEYFIPELPEVVTKVPPDHPQAAREAKIQGTVIVQTLVGEDGRVRDTRVGKSIPGLDEAAVSCVRKWVFKPARGGGKPVAVWVAVPVKFSRH